MPRRPWALLGPIPGSYWTADGHLVDKHGERLRTPRYRSAERRGLELKLAHQHPGYDGYAPTVSALKVITSTGWVLVPLNYRNNVEAENIGTRRAWEKYVKENAQ